MHSKGQGNKKVELEVGYCKKTLERGRKTILHKIRGLGTPCQL